MVRLIVDALLETAMNFAHFHFDLENRSNECMADIAVSYYHGQCTFSHGWSCGLDLVFRVTIHLPI